MKENGFTLIELLAVITIICLAAILISIRVTNNIKQANNIASDYQIDMIETAANLYAMNYSSEIPSINTTNVATVTLNTLVSKGLISSSSISELNNTDIVLIANIENNIKVDYDKNQSGKNVIFLNGLNEISIKKNTTYIDMGAYVVVDNNSLIELDNNNMSSTVDSDEKGNYTVTYSYTNANDIIRKVKVI